MLRHSGVSSEGGDDGDDGDDGVGSGSSTVLFFGTEDTGTVYKMV